MSTFYSPTMFAPTPPWKGSNYRPPSPPTPWVFLALSQQELADLVLMIIFMMMVGTAIIGIAMFDKVKADMQRREEETLRPHKRYIG